MKITVAQINPTIGDIDGNLSKITDIMARYHAVSDLIVFPELALSGYPPRDLLEKRWFTERISRAVQKLVQTSSGYPESAVLYGTPLQARGGDLYNAAVIVQNGRMLFSQPKSLLPSYDVFEETRYFLPAPGIAVFPFKDEVLGISVCEDAWNAPGFRGAGGAYETDPIKAMADAGATLLINISASPFYMAKDEIRFRLVGGHARRYNLPFIYVNQVGGNDELIFDGRSMFVDGRGKPAVIFPAFEEHVGTLDSTQSGSGSYVPLDRMEAVYRALVLGIRDYLHKTGFSKAVIGLSGGIDSALVCCLAKEALGAGNVTGISMPSPFSSPGSIEDAGKLAANLGVDFKVIPVTRIYQSYLDTLGGHFAGREADVTEENIQARIRGNILMAFSNKYGHLVLSTGNKSEMAVGYCTLYGDMSGGLSVISDVPKTMVYELAQYVNRTGEIIPGSIIAKAPSAELRPNQTDQDTLPPYPLLDRILHYYIEEGLSPEEIAARGMCGETVRRVIRMVHKSEYKRRQAAPGLKVTSKAFGSGRRMPIAAKY
ncbi:MAG: NAD+ synthase [Bacillota bacterium]